MTQDSQFDVSRGQGFFKSLIGFLCSAYLILMIGYLALRLLFLDKLWWLALLNAFAVYTFVPVFVLIPLSLITRLWRHVARLGVVALLAIVWFGPFFQPPTVEKYSGGTLLHVVTFNMWGDNERLDDVEAWLYDTDADIVLLQEIVPDYAEANPLVMADLYPYQTDLEDRLAWGNMILSRYPILEADNSNEHQQRVVVNVSGQQLAVYNIHFEMPKRETARINIDTGNWWLDLALKYDETERNEQIKALLVTLDGETLPYIVAGDFNMSQHSIIYSSLAVNMTDSYRKTHAGLGVTWPTGVLSGTPMLRIDYIWLSDDFRPLDAENGPELGSDHLPVVATVELLPAATSENPESE